MPAIRALLYTGTVIAATIAIIAVQTITSASVNAPDFAFFICVSFPYQLHALDSVVSRTSRVLVYQKLGCLATLLTGERGRTVHSKRCRCLLSHHFPRPKHIQFRLF